MKIDASRFNLFWQNPDRYRLRELWKLAPIEPAAGTFASLMTYGRRRGTSMHEFLDGRYRGVQEAQTVQELKDGGFGDREIEAGRRMAAAVKDDETLLCEVLFDTTLPFSEHRVTGRIDRIIRRGDEVLILDYKSSKQRTKAEIRYKLDDYCKGAQVSFYYLGCRSLGIQPSGFVYCLVEDHKDGVNIYEQRTHRTSLELKSFQRTVNTTCDLIEHLLDEYGKEDSWPVLAEPFTTGYESLLGHKMFDYTPDGFTNRIEHLVTMKEGAPDATSHQK